MNARDIWEPAALILGFQAASFWWRMGEESRVSHSGDITWLPVADAINVLSIGMSILGVFVFPVSGYRVLLRPQHWFGLSLLLLLGHMVALPAHYELFDMKRPRSMRYFPRQERIAVAGLVAAAALYLFAVHPTT
jgi:hypothetical protein